MSQRKGGCDGSGGACLGDRGGCSPEERMVPRQGPVVGDSLCDILGIERIDKLSICAHISSTTIGM